MFQIKNLKFSRNLGEVQKARFVSIISEQSEFSASKSNVPPCVAQVINVV